MIKKTNPFFDPSVKINRVSLVAKYTISKLFVNSHFIGIFLPGNLSLYKMKYPVKKIRNV